MRRVGSSLIDALLECPQGPEIVRRVLERVAQRSTMEDAFSWYQRATARTDRPAPPTERVANHAMGLAGECAEANVAKLRRRYPDGFSEAASIARVDAQAGAGRKNGATPDQDKGEGTIVEPAASEGPSR